MAIATKECTQCHKIKMLGFFSRDTRNKDGHRAACSDCVTIYQKRVRALKAKQQKLKRLDNNDD